VLLSPSLIGDTDEHNALLDDASYDHRVRRRRWRPGAQTEPVEVFVNDPRPLKEAILQFIERYPVTITYEDPRYEFAGDVRDVTDEVRRAPNPENHRTLIPSGGVLQTSYAVSRDTAQPVNVALAIQGMVETKNADPVGGRFGVYQSGQAFHVVPVEIRRSNGAWVRQTSVLDVPISLTLQETDGYHLLEAILKQVSAASGQDIGGPDFGRLSNPLFRYKGKVEAKDQPAREVLMTTLHSINPRFSWTLNYDPSGRSYFFNVVVSAEPLPPAVDPFELPVPRPGDLTPGGPPVRPRND
jgi:hypothetical protein